MVVNVECISILAIYFISFFELINDSPEAIIIHEIDSSDELKVGDDHVLILEMAGVLVPLFITKILLHPARKTN